MRLAFLGTPDAAVESLRALVDAGHDVAVVVTRPDRRRGRGSQLSASPVKNAATELGLRVVHHHRDLDAAGIERAVVVAYGAMIPAPLLALTPMLNVHFSLLPRWRGAAPVQRAILAGDETTGVSVMSLEPTLDTGPVHLVRTVSIGEKTASQLTNELAQRGARALVDVLDSPELLAHPQVQHGHATYAEKLRPQDFHLTPDLSTELQVRTVRLERAFTFINDRRLRVHEAHAVSAQGPAGSIVLSEGSVVLLGRDGALALDEVQPEGSRKMAARDWWAGARLGDSSPQWS